MPAIVRVCVVVRLAGFDSEGSNMPIYPLEQFEADVTAYEKELIEHAKSIEPRTVVVRFGSLKLIGEYPALRSVKPGCGSKFVVKTHRGTELATVLTSTCPNSGCSHSLTRKEVLQYVNNSGGRDYPMYANGRVLRLATPEDLQAQERIEQSKHKLKMRARSVAQAMDLSIRIIDAEPILGREVLTFYYTSEDKVDTHDLAASLRDEHQTRVDLKHIGARDDARLTADYERCGQHCCCKSFLKVLKPVSMRSAKTQKATLDPLKISGRCGRLMCCLRYEDQTYTELKKNLPHRKSKVGTPLGDGIVLDSQILTQLIKVRLESNEIVVVPIEELCKPGTQPKPAASPPPAPSAPPSRSESRSSSRSSTGRSSQGDQAAVTGDGVEDRQDQSRKKRRRRRKRKTADESSTPSSSSSENADGSDVSQAQSATPSEGASTTPGATDDDQAKPRKKRRRRRQRKGPGNAGNSQDSDNNGPPSTPPSSDSPSGNSPDS